MWHSLQQPVDLAELVGAAVVAVVVAADYSHSLAVRYLDYSHSDFEQFDRTFHELHDDALMQSGRKIQSHIYHIYKINNNSYFYKKYKRINK